MILVVLAAVMAVPIIYLPADWAGWLAAYASFAVVPLFLSFKRRTKIVLAIWGVVLLHQLIAVYNAYISTLHGVDVDAVSFHRDASAVALIGGWDFGLGARFYTTLLGLVYALAGPSQFLGAQTSVFAFALSCVVLVKMLELLEVENGHAACVLAFGLHPALSIFTSVTMRESWQILFFMQSAYCLLRFRLSARPDALLWGMLGGVLMGCLHKGLIIYILFMIPLALFSRIGKISVLTLQRVLGIAMTATVTAGLVAAVATNSLPNTPTLAKFTQGEGMEYASTYRERAGKGARAEYDVKLDASSPVAFAMTLPLVYVYYMLSPFPWQIRTGLDLFGALDAWLRMLLLFFALTALRSPPRQAPPGVPRFLILLYFSMSILWSMGTINYGTSIRHHIVPYWILIVLGVPPLFARARKLTRWKIT